MTPSSSRASQSSPVATPAPTPANTPGSSSTPLRYDILVIGGGPGGYVAAIRAAQLGFKTALLEREALGGVCLNWGCIPTKALLYSAELYGHLQTATQFGLRAREVTFELDGVVQRSRRIAQRLSQGVSFLMRKNKIDVFMGQARLLGPNRVHFQPLQAGEPAQTAKAAKTAETMAFTAPHIILATGTRARALPALEPDGEFVLTYRKAMIPERLPERLLVVGSGAIGMEFASFYHAMGTEVHVIEALDRILPTEDAEIAEFARKACEKRGIKITTKTQIETLERPERAASGGGAGGRMPQTEKQADKQDKRPRLRVHLSGQKTPDEVEQVLLAVGVVGNLEGLGLENTKIQTHRGCIQTDIWGQTAEPGHYAIGDVAGPPMLAHKAEHEGVACVEKIAQRLGRLAEAHPLDKTRVPGCVYSAPQIASVGMTEAQAREAGLSLRVGRFPFIGNGKALALGAEQGLVKTIFDAESGRLVGAHLVGPDVTELIQGFVIAMGLETTEAELMRTVFPHPTLSEMMHESVLNAWGRAIHI